jgi:hypothetical protein
VLGLTTATCVVFAGALDAGGVEAWTLSVLPAIALGCCPNTIALGRIKIASRFNSFFSGLEGFMPLGATVRAPICVAGLSAALGATELVASDLTSPGFAVATAFAEGSAFALGTAAMLDGTAGTGLLNGPANAFAPDALGAGSVAGGDKFNEGAAGNFAVTSFASVAFNTAGAAGGNTLDALV